MVALCAALASALSYLDKRNARSVSPTIPSTNVPTPRTVVVQIARATMLRTALVQTAKQQCLADFRLGKRSDNPCVFTQNWRIGIKLSLSRMFEIVCSYKEAMSDFDVQRELSTLKAQTQAIRKRAYSARKSRLDKYRTHLLELHHAGATGAELQRWLRINKRVKVTHSTVLRWLAKHG